MDAQLLQVIMSPVRFKEVGGTQRVNRAMPHFTETAHRQFVEHYEWDTQAVYMCYSWDKISYQLNEDKSSISFSSLQSALYHVPDLEDPPQLSFIAIRMLPCNVGLVDLA